MLTLREFLCWRWVNCWLGVSLSIYSAFDRLIDALLIASWILMVLMIISIQFLLTLSFWLPRSFSIGHLKVLLGLKTLLWLPTWTNLSERDSICNILVKMTTTTTTTKTRRSQNAYAGSQTCWTQNKFWAFSTASCSCSNWSLSLWHRIFSKPVKVISQNSCKKKRMNWASSRFQVFPLLEIHCLEAFL